MTSYVKALLTLLKSFWLTDKETVECFLSSFLNA